MARSTIANPAVEQIDGSRWLSVAAQHEEGKRSQATLRAEQIEERGVGAILFEDRSTPVPPIEVGMASQFSARNTRHKGEWYANWE